MPRRTRKRLSVLAAATAVTLLSTTAVFSIAGNSSAASTTVAGRGIIQTFSGGAALVRPANALQSNQCLAHKGFWTATQVSAAPAEVAADASASAKADTTGITANAAVPAGSLNYRFVMRDVLGAVLQTVTVNVPGAISDIAVDPETDNLVLAFGNSMQLMVVNPQTRTNVMIPVKGTEGESIARITYLGKDLLAVMTPAKGTTDFASSTRKVDFAEGGKSATLQPLTGFELPGVTSVVDLTTNEEGILALVKGKPTGAPADGTFLVNFSGQGFVIGNPVAVDSNLDSISSTQGTLLGVTTTGVVKALQLGGTMSVGTHLAVLKTPVTLIASNADARFCRQQTLQMDTWASLMKGLNSTEDGKLQVGDSVTLHYDVTNAGDLPLSDVKVTDKLLEVLGVQSPSLPLGTSLTANQVAQLSADSITVTEANIDYFAAATRVAQASATTAIEGAPVLTSNTDVAPLVVANVIVPPKPEPTSEPTTSQPTPTDSAPVQPQPTPTRTTIRPTVQPVQTIAPVVPFAPQPTAQRTTASAPQGFTLSASATVAEPLTPLTQLNGNGPTVRRTSSASQMPSFTYSPAAPSVAATPSASASVSPGAGAALNTMPNLSGVSGSTATISPSTPSVGGVVVVPSDNAKPVASADNTRSTGLDGTAWKYGIITGLVLLALTAIVVLRKKA